MVLHFGYVNTAYDNFWSKKNAQKKIKCLLVFRYLSLPAHVENNNGLKTFEIFINSTQFQTSAKRPMLQTISVFMISFNPNLLNSMKEIKKVSVWKKKCKFTNSYKPIALNL